MRGLWHRDNRLINRLSLRFFLMTLVFCLSLAGINAALIIGMSKAAWPQIVMVHIILFYWIGAAAFLTWYIRRQINSNYEIPAKSISRAANRIARGDFEVEIPLIHEEEDKQDLFDQTIQDVNRMAEELKSIETLKTDFVSNVSHEMKTPLSVIINYAELLQGELAAGRAGKDASACGDREEVQGADAAALRAAEYAGIIEDNAKRMADLIADILRLSRMENQKILPKLQPFDLTRQLTDCILGFEPRWTEKELDLDIDLQEDVQLVSDASLLPLVWNNLLSNAIKFSPQGGRLTVTLRQGGGAAGTEADEADAAAERGEAASSAVRPGPPDFTTVTVRDEGPGMDVPTLRRIFDKFYQGDTSHAAEGNGLGLAMAAQVLQLLGGEIAVDSRPREGACFTVRLPQRAQV